VNDRPSESSNKYVSESGLKPLPLTKAEALLLKSPEANAVAAKERESAARVRKRQAYKERFFTIDMRRTFMSKPRSTRAP
jgi:hypothetical protein